MLTFGLILYESGKSDAADSVRRAIFSAGISKISVKDSSGEFSLALEKKDWFITSPFRWAANPFTVNRLLNELRFLGADGGFSVAEARATGGTLADYGLENPRATLSVSDDAGTRQIRIGNATPDRKSVYVLSPDGSEIIPAPKSFLDVISKKSEDFRAREIFSVAPYEVQSLKILSFEGQARDKESRRVSLVRTRRENDGVAARVEYGWRFETPISAAAETARTEARLRELVSLNYGEFFFDKPSLLGESGVKTPQMSITLSDGNEKSQTLLIGKLTPENKHLRYAKLDGNDAIFTVPADIADRWERATSELRDPHFFDFDPAQLRSVTIFEGKKQLLLHRTNLRAAGAKKVDSGAVALGADADEPVAVADASAENLYAAWQMPAAPDSRVVEPTAVEPAVMRDFVETLKNLCAENFPDPEKTDAEPGEFYRAFAADNASEVEIESFGFKRPARVVELQFGAPVKDAESPRRTMTLSVAEPPADKPGAPCHAKFGGSIYAVGEKILESLSTEPSFFRSREIWKLPEDAKILAVRIFDVADSEEKTVLDERRPAGVADWAKALEAKTDETSKALCELMKLLADFRAESFLPEPFSRDFSYDYQDSGARETWRFRLELEIAAAAEDAEPTRRVLWLTKRLGGTFQLAGTPEPSCVFRIRQPLIDALHKLTFARDSSRDVPEIPVPEPVGREAPASAPAAR
ncbi:MAG: DUF4340 domain-containing protein [Candidatus Spyradosoma sp.]